jgi:hypothetical protein
MDVMTLAGDLEKVGDGSLAGTEFVRRYSAYAEPLVESVLSGFHHFVADEDLRKKDEAYALMQLCDLKKMIALLKSGADPTEIRRITFLNR